MNAASSPALTRTDKGTWAERYERLRRLGLQLGAPFRDDGGGLGQFLREGRVSWLQSPVVPAATQPANLAPRAHVALVHRDRFDVTRLLATMVGAAAAEVGA